MWKKYTHNVSVSFQIGFSDALIVFVFFLTLSVSGMSFNFTYGSLNPFGSIGIRFRPSLTEIRRERERKERNCKRNQYSHGNFESNGSYRQNVALPNHMRCSQKNPPNSTSRAFRVK